MPAYSKEEQIFINRVAEIVEANLNNNHFDVKKLAAGVGMSHSQLHRRLKAISKQTASQFIREYRLEKAKKLLHNNLSASEIAYQVGFGSPTYFNKCFHDYFGYTPGEYKSQIQDSSDENLISEETSISKRILRFWIKLPVFSKTILIISGILILLIISFSKHIFNVDPSLDKSIAVLPFKNLSNESANQHFSEGMMDDIINHLSHIKEFTVISRTSTEQYRMSRKPLSQIAKELGVSYVIEGSAQKHKNRVKIIIQLVDSEDKHIWSESFDREFSNIFSLQSEIAKQVALKLKTVLSPQEIEQIDKQYTKNLEAYNLYLTGLFYWRLRGEENVKKSIEYFNQALAKDSNYCLAYAGLADAYFILSFPSYLFLKEKALANSNKFARKALSIDNNLAEAHATLGGIATYFEYNWDYAKKEFKEALEINPNYATAHQWYSEYLDITGNEVEARKHINRALELNPQSTPMLWISYHQYFKNGDYENALLESEKLFGIDKDTAKQCGRKFGIFLRQSRDEKAIKEFEKMISIYTPEINVEILDSIYSESGIEGIQRFKIGWDLKNESVRYYIIARQYALISDKSTALDYLEKSYEKGEINMISIKYDEDYKILRAEPRFQTLLKKLNLED